MSALKRFFFLYFFLGAYGLGTITIATDFNWLDLDARYDALVLIYNSIPQNLENRENLISREVFKTIKTTQFFLSIVVVYFLLMVFFFKDNFHIDVVVDSPYFLGFLFTLTALVMAFHQMNISSNQLGFNFINQAGIALITSIAGMLCRVILSALGPMLENENSKKFPFYFIETKESFDTALKNCKVVRESKVLKTLVIDKVQLLEFPATKESGKAWDNAFASYKPDIYLSITDLKQNSIYKQPNYFNNQTNEDLPLNFEFKPELKIEESKYKDGIAISFYDHDSATNHDLLGYVAFNTFKEHYDSIKTIQEFKANGVKVKLTFHYE